MDVDENGELINQSEYYAFGGTAMNNNYVATADMLRHYRYSGKELDSVTGLYYNGACYYFSHLGRWLNPDPAGFLDGVNLYG